MGTTIEEWSENGKANEKCNKTCKNCRHFCPYVYEFDEDVDSDQLYSDFGECRRFPPSPASHEEAVFPVVEETMWCGEFDF